MMYHYFIGGSRDCTKWSANEAPPQFNTASLFHNEHVALDGEFIVRKAEKVNPDAEFYRPQSDSPQYETYKLFGRIVVDNNDVFVYGAVDRGVSR